MATCPISLYQRTSKVIRAASFHSESAQNMARRAERDVRAGYCDDGRKMLRAAIRIIRKDIKRKRRGARR